MSVELDRIKEFVAYVHSLEGSEQQESQVYCEHLFQAFGHKSLRAAEAKLESKLKEGSRTKRIDLIWGNRLLIEMKSRGERLQSHYRQAFEYWLRSVPNRPKYVVLCNFDEFWIYDFNVQLEEPLDRLGIDDLPRRYEALNFLFPDERKPDFENNKVEVTETAAEAVAAVFRSLLARGKDRAVAQRFVLQCIVAMFAEDFNLLKPRGLFKKLIKECIDGESTMERLGVLFRQMNSKERPSKGTFAEVDYFNGGLFEKVEPLDLNAEELELMQAAAAEDWAKVSPPIFGTIFQASMEQQRRHDIGAHFTFVSDIQKVILPTIVRPWRERIKATDTLAGLMELKSELENFKILDPACGSGNFLYVAYRELVNLEMEILAKIHDNFQTKVATTSLVSAKQLYGMDTDGFAVELAKVTLMLGKRIALHETHESWFAERKNLPLQVENALPLDNLDNNIKEADALFSDWPEVDAIIGNPPFLSKSDKLRVLGREYLDDLQEKYPEVPGRADLCVYWFRRAHDELKPGDRAGLIGTKTISQNYSRHGGLDYIVGNDGTITEAVASQVWPGDAVVRVAIVNWVKGEDEGMKSLFRQDGDQIYSPWKVEKSKVINPDLTIGVDVTKALDLTCNSDSLACFQGQTHNHDGFLLTPEQAAEMRKDKRAAPVLHPYLIGLDLLLRYRPSRYAIDLNHCDDIQDAMRHGPAFEHVKAKVMPDILADAEAERKKGGRAKERQNHAKRWWRFWRGRGDMMSAISQCRRYVACVRTTRRPVFEFIDPAIHPNDAMQVFPLEDDYSFGILQSDIHWQWFVARCSTFKRDWRYTSNTVFDSYPWPQEPALKDVKAVAEAARAVRDCRRKLMAEDGTNLRDLYRTLDVQGKNRLRDAHEDLAAAVKKTYGIGKKTNVLAFLLDLNHEVAEREANEEEVTGPGLPEGMRNRRELFSDDRLRMPK